jgi:hypothetical protein
MGQFEFLNLSLIPFPCSLFKDAFTRSDYIASGDRVIANNDIGMELERSGCGLM